MKFLKDAKQKKKEHVLRLLYDLFFEDETLNVMDTNGLTYG